MKKRYDEVMDRIEVTREMRERILSNIEKTDIGATQKSKVIPFPSMKKYMSAAACFVLLLAGVFAAGHMAGIFQPDDPPVQVVNGIVEVDTLEQLAAAVGFEIEELGTLPFEVETTTYISYWGEMAEVSYTGEGQTSTFRKSRGTEDNSGDYSVYSAAKEITICSLTVTLKGSGEVYTLATWSADGYAYSISLSNGISEPGWYDFIAGVFEQ